MKDVRIATYATKRGDVAHIRFYNGMEALIDSDYIKLSGKAKRLYFMPADLSTGVKLNKLAQVQKASHVALLRNYVGEYPLKSDNDLKLYYIDLEDKVPIEVDSGRCAGIPHQSTLGRRGCVPKDYNKPTTTDFKSKIKDIVFDYVTKGELDKAQFTTELAEKLGI